MENQSNEEWRQIEGYPDYEVSSLGRVRLWKRLLDYKCPRILRQQTGGKMNGRVVVSLYRDGKPHIHFIHQLVACAWLGPCPLGLQTSHIDECCTNNRADNLCYETAKENHNRPKALIRNSRGAKIGISGFRGVQQRSNGRYRAYTQQNKRRVSISHFSTAIEAACAVDTAIKLNKSFCVTNKELGLL